MKKKFLAAVLALTTVFTCAFTFVGCAKDNQTTSTIEQVATPQEEKSISTKFVNTKHVKMMASTPMTVNTDATVSQTLVASITPSTATNQEVDWTVSWLAPNSTFASGKNVTDYVTVEPESDGSTTATITCYQAFEGEILVTVTTREGGFQADCIVTFVGVPSTISLIPSQSLPTSGSTYGLGVGVTYDFNIRLSNVFGVVGEKFHDYSVGVTGVGTLTVGTLEDDPRASEGVWYDTRTANVSEFASQILSCTIEGDVLKLTFNKSIEGFYSSMVRNGTVKTYYDRVKSVDSVCTFIVQVSTKELGLSFNTKIKVQIDSSVVTDVSVTPTLEF